MQQGMEMMQGYTMEYLEVMVSIDGGSEKVVDSIEHVDVIDCVNDDGVTT